MLQFFYGHDVEKNRFSLKKNVECILKESPSTHIVKIDIEQWSAAKIEELLFSRPLFEEKMIVILEYLLLSDDAKESIISRLHAMVSSPNLFFVLEKEIEPVFIAKFRQCGALLNPSAGKSPGKKVAKDSSQFNIFAVAEALMELDRKKLWITLHKAFFAGITAEEIHNILFWQIKSMCLAKKCKSPGEANMNPFVYNKTKKGSVNFTQPTFNALSGLLLEIYHNARKGRPDLNTGLEKFALTLPQSMVIYTQK